MAGKPSSNLFEGAPEGDAEVVTALRPLPSDPNIVSVRVGRRSVAKVRASVAEELGLEPGTAWTEELADSIEQHHRIERARRDALRLLGHRDLTGAELATRLERKAHPPAVIEAALAAMVDEGWVDEAALAERYLEYLTRDRPASADFLRARLLARGVSPEIADHALVTVLGDVDPVDAAEALARTRLEALRNLPPATRARRLAGLLGRRGFDDETVADVLQRLGPQQVETPD